MTKKNRSGGLAVTGEVYNVRERMEDAGVPGDWSKDHWEYEVTLVDRNGRELDSWDSLTETYNPGQELTKALAQRSFNEVVRDVAAGDAKKWFNRAPDTTPPAAKRAAAMRPKKTGAPTGITVRGIR